jgi:hypothetical protein
MLPVLLWISVAVHQAAGEEEKEEYNHYDYSNIH